MVKAKYINDTPFSSKDSIGKSQYHRQQWDKTFLPWIHSLTNQLVTQSSRIGLNINRLYDRFIKSVIKEMTIDKEHIETMNFRRHCDLSILTIGNNSSLGFANTCHIDKNDHFSDYFQDVAQMITMKIKESAGSQRDVMKIVTYLESMKRLGKYGTTTVCGYQKLLWSPEFDDKHLVAFFLNIGLGTCYDINSGMFQSFYGHLFSHQTAVPVIVKDNTVMYNHNSVKLFGWGGGSAAERHKS